MSGERTVSEQVVETVANRTGADALELPPLYDAVDPEALDRVLERAANGEVSFRYAGQHVTVSADRTVSLDALGDAAGRTSHGE